MTASGNDTLLVAEDLELPADVITQRIAIIGRTGSGKTSTGVVLAEEMIRGHLPVVILDPLGVWHGLRSNAAGDGPGLSVVIFGGDHADLPLPPGSGQLVAEVIVEQRPAAVIDLSGLDSDAEIRRWCAAFLKQLYRLNRNPLHVIVDEADLLAPQQGAGEAAHSLSATKSVARRGRVRGLGLTLITQRPASLAKEVLNQAELLVAMQLTGPRDVAAVDDWMSQAGDEATVRDVRASLPSLKVGESWWWSPSWLRLLQRVQVRPRATFDSSRTPRPGETRVEPTATAAVDLDALAERLAALGDAEPDAGDDTAALRRRITDLERQLRDRPAAVPERVEVPVVLDADLQSARAVVDDLRGLVSSLANALDHAAPQPSAVTPPITPASKPIEPRPVQPTPGRAETSGGLDLPRAQAAILRTLAQHAEPLTNQQVAVLTGYSMKSSGFANALGALRSAGLATPAREPLTATAEGRARVGDVPPSPRGHDLAQLWLAKLGRAPRTLLQVLLDTAPSSLTHDQLAAASTYSPTSSGFANALGQLRSLGLAHGTRAGITVSSHLTGGTP